MTALFLVVFIVGLLLAVRVMLFGIERPAPGSTPLVRAGEPKLHFGAAAIAAFAVVAGVVGYLLLRSTGRVTAATVAAVASGAVAAALATWGSAVWARVVPEHDPDDPRYVLQGHLAHVTAPIASGGHGEIAFEIGNERHVRRARSIDDAALAVGTEVVIERIEDDVVYVEPWLQVEKRL